MLVMSYFLLVRSLKLKRKKTVFSPSQHYMNLLLKLLKKKRKKKRKINGSYFNFSFEVDADLEKIRDGNFCLLKTLDLLKTTVKTAIKTLAFV